MSDRPYCCHCGNFVERANFVGLCWVCATFEIPLRTQIWVWFKDVWRGER